MENEGNASRGVHVWPVHACLLSELAQELVSCHREHLHEVLVILPTQRQVTSLLALLAHRLGAFRPPELLTLEPFVSQEADRLSRVSLSLPATASDLLQELLLAAIMREKGYRHLQLGHEHEIKQFFNDIAEYGMGEEAFSRLQEVMERDVYRAELHLGSLLDRIHELADLHRSFFALLAEHGMSTPSLAMAERAHRLSRVWAEESMAPRRWVYLACFTTIREYFKPLFHTLLAKPNASLWLSEPPALYSEVNPLAELSSAFGTPTQRRPAVDAARTAAGEPICFVHERESILEEVAFAFELAGRYEASGCPPAQIAIILTNEKSYGKITRTFAARQNISANLAISTPLAQTTLGVWLNAMMEWFGNDQRSTDLLTFMTHPITVAWLGRQRGNGEALDAQTLSIALSHAQHTKSPYRPLSEELNDVALARSLESVREALDPLLKLGRTAGTKFGLRQWAEAFSEVFATFGLWEQTLGQDLGVAQSSVTALEELTEALFDTCVFHDSRLTRQDFWQLVRDKLVGLETRSIGYPLRGYQVLNLIESRYIPFRVVIILGCVEGAFPKALPKDYLIDDWLKAQIGLPGWQYVEALEDTTFQLLRARIPRLNLAYPRQASGEQSVRSRFVERLISASEARFAAAQSDAALLALLANEGDEAESALVAEHWLQCSFDKRGAFAGDRWSLMGTVSATSLEQLLHCPYRFLLSQLGVRRVLPQAEPGAREEGAWLHDILQAFFTGSARGRQWLTPLPERVACAEWATMALARLKSLTAQLASLSLAQAPLYEHLMAFAWPRFVEHLGGFLGHSPDRAHYEWPLTSRHEWGLGVDGGASLALVPLEVGGERLEFRVRGVLDRVDIAGGSYVLTDYKRKTLPRAGEIALGLAPQLVLYAMALDVLRPEGERLPAEGAVLGYWSILSASWETVALGEKASSFALDKGLLPAGSKKVASLPALRERLAAVWAWRAEALLVRGAPFAPDPGKACTFCEFAGVCRRGDPHVPRQASGPLALRRWLAEEGSPTVSKRG